MKNHVASLALYLQLVPLSNKLGISPCLITDAKVNKTAFASLNNPGIKNKPLNAIKVSLPQHLVYPHVKNGNPADTDNLL